MLALGVITMHATPLGSLQSIARLWQQEEVPELSCLIWRRSISLMHLMSYVIIPALL